jgi:hypothetical protein
LDGLQALTVLEHLQQRQRRDVDLLSSVDLRRVAGRSALSTPGTLLHHPLHLLHLACASASLDAQALPATACQHCLADLLDEQAPDSRSRFVAQVHLSLLSGQLRMLERQWRWP